MRSGSGRAASGPVIAAPSARAALSARSRAPPKRLVIPERGSAAWEQASPTRASGEVAAPPSPCRRDPPPGASLLWLKSCAIVAGSLSTAPLAKHVAYLKREGVTRDGEDARLFDAASDSADGKAFAERCGEDRHNFRFIVSPEDAPQMADLRAFTRELMKDVERDLGTKLHWVAVDHWNTDNPHVHVLVRGKADDGKDLVISRDYMSQGFRQRAAERVGLELGPRSEKEIKVSLEKEVEAERWTSLDRALRNIADESAGFLDLRPGAVGEDPELRRLLVGRAGKLERLGLAEPIGPAQWSLKPGLERSLRDLGVRGDIIKTMHRAIRRLGRNPDVTGFALHGEEPSTPIVGRLVERGLHDELKATAYAIVEGVDGRTHHLRFADLELTGDGAPGAIVEVRAYKDASRRQRLSLATRSDLSIDEQVVASGATWLDRQLVAGEPIATAGGIRRRGAGRDGSARGSSYRARSRGEGGPEDHIRARPLKHVAPARASQRDRDALSRNRACA